MHWTMYNGATHRDLGLIPAFLSDHLPEGAVEQINEAYAHGGGWRDFSGFTLNIEGRERADWTLDYKGDSPMRLLAATLHHREVVLVFECAWVCVVAEDNTYRVARLD